MMAKIILCLLVYKGSTLCLPRWTALVRHNRFRCLRAHSACCRDMSSFLDPLAGLSGIVRGTLTSPSGALGSEGYA